MSDNTEGTDEPKPLPIEKQMIAVPLKGLAMSMFTPVIWGVRHMVGILGEYIPDPPPSSPTGGQSGTGSNVIPFRRKTNAVAKPSYVSTAMPMRKAA